MPASINYTFDRDEIGNGSDSLFLGIEDDFGLGDYYPGSDCKSSWIAYKSPNKGRKNFNFWALKEC